MIQEVINELYSYAVNSRRHLHEYPEIGFELEKTVAFVSAELDKMGIEYTDCYGKCSIVADVGSGNRIIAFRADMDALPVEEKTGLPYSSKIKGAMHACGHDSHTAILLAVAKYLKANEDKLPCRIRLIFQPSEEGAVSGARMMVNNGVMNGVEQVICTHCENSLEVGKIGICYGDYMAACIPATIKFFGKSTHAALPKFGVDAIAMASEAYNELKTMVEREAHGKSYIWSVGRFSGGQVHNVVADKCEMDISFRFYDMSFAKRVEKQMNTICSDISDRFGGKFEADWHMSSGVVHNDENLVATFEKTAKSAGLDLQTILQKMSSEDFCWYLEKAPGMIFRFGTRNETLGCTALAHRNDFCIDEEGMRSAIIAFCEYAMNC